MDFGRLFERTWDIVWEHKFLILLGVLVILGGRGGMNPFGFDFNADGSNGVMRLPTPPENWEMPDLGQIGLPLANIILLVIVGGLGLIVGIALWVVSTIARGGLIAGASTIDAGGVSDLSSAWNAGWRKGWRLLGIGLLPAIPGFFLLLLGLLGFLSYAATSNITGSFGTDLPVGPGMGLGAILAGISCLLVPVTFVLGLLRALANRACMLEDLGVFAAYGRGFSVLIENFGQALLLFIIQIIISVAIGLAMLLPGIIMVLCCLLWPLLILIQGVIAAYFSTLWTLAWREWTGESQAIAPTA